MPRERLLKYGAKNLLDEELLAILISTGTKKENVLSLSTRIIKNLENIKTLEDMTFNELTKYEGIGIAKAITIIAAIELGKRIIYKIDQPLYFNKSETVYEFMRYDLEDEKQEQFYVLFLDSKLKLIQKKCLFIGTLNKSLVSPREVFKYAYKLDAYALILVHNHPSGDSTPSKDDIEITKNFMTISDIFGLKIIDHIIIGKNRYDSVINCI